MSEKQHAPRIIAIDGPAASGKGTIAKRLAAHYDFAHMDTGALYRLVGWRVLQQGGIPSDEHDARRAALDLSHDFTAEMADMPAIRAAAVGNAASEVAAFSTVRDILYDLQVSFANNPPHGKRGAVLDGRDIGTVICPHAAVKLFITATTEERSRRRTLELQAKNQDVHYDNILAEMRVRDERDSTRAAAPLKIADGAFVIDTTDMNADLAFETARAKVATFF